MSPDNLVPLNLSQFSRTDIAKIEGIGEKLRLMRRWFRHELGKRDGCAEARIYSGDRGPLQYAAFRILRCRDGMYALFRDKDKEPLIRTRTIDAAINAIPDEFFYTDHRREG